MAGTLVRHLVLEMFDIAPYAVIACTPGRVLFDPRHHTMMTAMTNCPECLAVHSAFCIVFAADLNS
jgi:hypothetical protein